MDDIRISFATVGVATIALALMIVPPHAFLRSNPVDWIKDVRTDKQKAKDEFIQSQNPPIWKFWATNPYADGQFDLDDVNAEQKASDE
jgi:hypothetical protein